MSLSTPLAPAADANLALQTITPDLEPVAFTPENEVTPLPEEDNGIAITGLPQRSWSDRLLLAVFDEALIRALAPLFKKIIIALVTVIISFFSGKLQGFFEGTNEGVTKASNSAKNIQAIDGSKKLDNQAAIAQAEALPAEAPTWEAPHYAVWENHALRFKNSQYVHPDIMEWPGDIRRSSDRDVILKVDDNSLSPMHQAGDIIYAQPCTPPLNDKQHYLIGYWSTRLNKDIFSLVQKDNAVFNVLESRDPLEEVLPQLPIDTYLHTCFVERKTLPHTAFEGA